MTERASPGQSRDESVGVGELGDSSDTRTFVWNAGGNIRRNTAIVVLLVMAAGGCAVLSQRTVGDQVWRPGSWDEVVFGDDEQSFTVHFSGGPTSWREWACATDSRLVIEESQTTVTLTVLQTGQINALSLVMLADCNDAGHPNTVDGELKSRLGDREILDGVTGRIREAS